MSTLGRVIQLVAHDRDGFRYVDRIHANGESHTKLKLVGQHWETVSHVEVRRRRPGDKWLP